MKADEQNREALERATTGQSTGNYGGPRQRRRERRMDSRGTLADQLSPACRTSKSVATRTALGVN